jgi:hypothetical protein
VLYGSYDLPFGKGKQYAQNANRLEDLIIGGYQISTVLNWSGGLPYSIGFSNFGTSSNPLQCQQNVGGTSAPCRPNATGKLSTSLTKFNPSTKSRTLWTPQSTMGGKFSFPGLDVIGNAGANNYNGPSFFNDDLAVTKAFNIRESIAANFRVDAFNAFNHINAGNPNNGDIFGSGPIQAQSAGAQTRQLEFSLRVQF